MSQAARLLGLAFLVLTACRSEEPAPAEAPQAAVDPHGDWLERMRHTPLESEVAINQEYEISAVFPKGRHVCTSDSGGHVHGFHQWLGMDCTTERPGLRDDRSISLWADYNAMDYDWDDVVRECSGGKPTPFTVKIEQGRGRAVACSPQDAAYGDIVVLVLAPPQEGPSDAPLVDYRVYSVRFSSDDEHRIADLRLFREFVSGLELRGVRLSVES